MKFDDCELEKVAAMVLRFNEHAKGYTVPQMVECMKRVALTSLADGTGYVSTRGFVLSAYTDPESGDVAVKASVAAYLFED